ncbi:NYN domain-containing protein [Coleofasciculus sp. FACHB-1120]|uniref:NYN domain-containing protein n=1 Tax=Coleofasciculus sp. FACHB-1120 TaxID=2692783 RepID=UPI001687C6B5|nr:NYN domain-containing protein [Coleofasciculus sp. FACHB-1120]MBD2744697.1 NYN domain-containing protein [Coleofasciculus sp. FACHB-1120]
MQRPSPQAVLLVDGYNVIGLWSYLQRTRDRNGLEAARLELIEALVNYSAFKGFETQVVFDAQYQDTRSNREAITHELSVYYTDFGQTADTYIEKTCASFRYNPYRSARRLIVATSDRAQQLTVVGYGAEWMSAPQLAYDVESTARAVIRKNRPKKHSSGRFLANSLDAKARERLAEWRLNQK